MVRSPTEPTRGHLILARLEPGAQRGVNNCNESIHFVGGEKGGVRQERHGAGARTILHHRKVPFCCGLTADQSQGVLLRSYGEYTRSVNLLAPESADQIMDRALGAERRVLARFTRSKCKSSQGMALAKADVPSIWLGDWGLCSPIGTS